MLKVFGRSSRGKPSYPIATTNISLDTHLYAIKIHSHGKMIDPRSLFHNQHLWVNPRSSDASSRMDYISIAKLQQNPPQRPGQNNQKEF
jgi:hypothetical protein